MSEATNIFMNSYLKKMRRPEMGGGFSPDDAFGANLVHGSESLNPNAIRDKTNAQYGNLKSPIQQGSSGNIPGVGSAQNIPFMGGSQNTPFMENMQRSVSTPMELAKTTAPNVLSPWLAEKLKDLVRAKPSDMLAGTMSLPAETPTETMMSALREPSFGVDSNLGGYSRIGEDLVKDVPMPSQALETGSLMEGFDPSFLGTTAAAAAAPVLMKTLTGSKLAGDVTGAATSVGTAAAQGGLNPVSDLAAVYSLYKLIRGLL